MKYPALWLVLLLYAKLLPAQEIKKETLLKTNTLNLLFLGLPSLHLEQELGVRSSLQFSLYQGRVVFISESKWAGASLQYRKYLQRKFKNCRGLYVSPGLNYHYDYKAYTPKQTYGLGFVALRTDAGYQHRFQQKRFLLDFGAGLYIPFLETYNFSSSDFEPAFRLNASIGWRLN